MEGNDADQDSYGQDGRSQSSQRADRNYRDGQQPRDRHYRDSRRDRSRSRSPRGSRRSRSPEWDRYRRQGDYHRRSSPPREYYMRRDERRYDNGPPPRSYRQPYHDRHPMQRSHQKGNRYEEGLPGVSLLVRNIAPDVRPPDLQSAFGRIGRLRDVYIPRDYHSQQPKGFAFVEFEDPREAEEARYEMHRFVLKGRPLEVLFAQERRKTPVEMRGRDTGRDHHRESSGSVDRKKADPVHEDDHKDKDHDNDSTRLKDDGYHSSGSNAEVTV